MKVRTSITLNKETKNKIEEQAMKENRSFSNLVEIMAKKYLQWIKSKK